jgi:hypothetical protein
MGINIARGVNVMREALSEAGLVPLELMAVAQEQAGRGTVFGVGPAELAKTVEALRAQGITIPLDEPAADVMLVTTVIDVLLYQDALRPRRASSTTWACAGRCAAAASRRPTSACCRATKPCRRRPASG